MPSMIRMNPIRAPMMKPIGTALPQTAPATHIAEQISGPLFSHLGHFANPVNLRRGHNTSGHWEQNAVKHPGVEKAKAKRNGVSTHEQLERDSHSSDPTTRKRGTLGLTFERQAARRKRSK